MLSNAMVSGAAPRVMTGLRGTHPANAPIVLRRSLRFESDRQQTALISTLLAQQNNLVSLKKAPEQKKPVSSIPQRQTPRCQQE